MAPTQSSEARSVLISRHPRLANISTTDAHRTRGAGLSSASCIVCPRLTLPSVFLHSAVASFRDVFPFDVARLCLACRAALCKEAEKTRTTHSPAPRRSDRWPLHYVFVGCARRGVGVAFDDFDGRVSATSQGALRPPPGPHSSLNIRRVCAHCVQAHPSLPAHAAARVLPVRLGAALLEPHSHSSRPEDSPYRAGRASTRALLLIANARDANSLLRSL